MMSSLPAAVHGWKHSSQCRNSRTCLHRSGKPCRWAPVLPQAGQGQAQSPSSGGTHDISCKKYLCHHELIL